VNVDGTLHAVDDTCSHAEVSLSEGEIADCTVECWLHGSAFDLTTGEPLSPPASRAIAVHTVTLGQGDDPEVSITLGRN
jgi:3-phenylpropionate/trans-cinnamate dioxygenase ferredoxin subunit